MNVLVVADGHYCRTPDGTVYCDSIYDYAFYRRYLSGFDHVCAAVRIEEVDCAPQGKKVSSGPGVEFLPIPAYRGPIEYIRKYFTILRFVRRYCKAADCAVFRIPAATSNIFCRCFSRLGKPFAVEVVIDPWENFAPGTAGNPAINWVVRRDWTRLVRTMCQKADGASYVTARYLQGVFPPAAATDPEKHFTANYSSVELPDGSFAQPRRWDDGSRPLVISHVSNLFTGYGKGHLQLMEAVKKVRDRGVDVSLVFIGDGPKRAEFERCAESLGIASSVRFAGKQPSGTEVRRILAHSDMFVLPTRAEGLPRALLEAMAEGLPCLSSPTCGVPEVLGSGFMFHFDDTDGFARGIERFANDRELMARESARNIECAKGYASSILDARRKEFYTRLHDITAGREGRK